MVQVVEILPLGRQGLVCYAFQYHVSRWPCDAKSQNISSHGVDLGMPEYPHNYHISYWNISTITSFISYTYFESFSNIGKQLHETCNSDICVCVCVGGGGVSMVCLPIKDWFQYFTNTVNIKLIEANLLLVPTFNFTKNICFKLKWGSTPRWWFTACCFNRKNESRMCISGITD